MTGSTTINDVRFITSQTDVARCPEPDKPEFALIGRSNVGKSSLINMLMQRKKLAKTSATPGKTQTINHFIVNDGWYLVDLPGYGYAQVSKAKKHGWSKMIHDYVLKRDNLYTLFILVDARLEPQSIDIEFINWAGQCNIPLCLVLTKVDKLNKSELLKNRARLEKKLRETWEELPPIINSSATTRAGREDIIQFIHTALATQN